MTVMEAVRGRFSVRYYKSIPVTESDLITVLDAARFSQSARNIQNWRFIVVRNSVAKEKLMKAAIAGVLAYLEYEENEKKHSENRWWKSGKEIQMNNRYLIQTKIFKQK